MSLFGGDQSVIKMPFVETWSNQSVCGKEKERERDRDVMNGSLGVLLRTGAPLRMISTRTLGFSKRTRLVFPTPERAIQR